MVNGIIVFFLERERYFMEEILLLDEVMVIIKRSLKLYSGIWKVMVEFFFFFFSVEEVYIFGFFRERIFKSVLFISFRSFFKVWDYINYNLV